MFDEDKISLIPFTLEVCLAETSALWHCGYGSPGLIPGVAFSFCDYLLHIYIVKNVWLVYVLFYYLKTFIHLSTSMY